MKVQPVFNESPAGKRLNLCLEWDSDLIQFRECFTDISEIRTIQSADCFMGETIGSDVSTDKLLLRNIKLQQLNKLPCG